MANRIVYTLIFEKYFKRYSKKFRSLTAELKNLELDLLENPKLGDPLGDGLFKIRLAVKSKGKGKSGGFRVITYLIASDVNGFTINLLMLYDKSEVADIPKEELLRILKTVL